MKSYLSIDGGGTKTAILLTDMEGHTLSDIVLGGCAYPQIGMDGLYKLLDSGISKLLSQAGLEKNQVISSSWGIPCFGENYEADEEIKKIAEAIIPDSPKYIGNDVEVGHAGSLALKPGIHMVAGTGAIGFGKNSNGETARSNGAHEDFSDEGSAYWLGTETLRLFVKQADGREKKGPLYNIIKDDFSLERDMEIVEYYNNNLAGKRSSISKIQILLYEAAIKGDASAINVYDRAAYELYLTIKSLYNKLFLNSESITNVSYYGGVYKAGKLILNPLGKYLSTLNVSLNPPILSPTSGGILLAAQKAGSTILDNIVLKRQVQESSILG